MEYPDDWSSCRIHAHDYASVNEVYSFRGTEYLGFKIRDLTPKRFGPEAPPPNGTWLSKSHTDVNTSCSM